jgi:serine/threonine protein kinase
MEFLNQKIGNYLITRVIGQGGMATVYEGLHEVLLTKVAVKVLNPILSVNPDLRERFENEAVYMAKLNHKSITRVIDIVKNNKVLAIIMELLDGEDLSARIKKKGPLKIEETIDVFLQLLDAFEYAHLNGIVHRDIKPSNIFIDKNNQVKVLDFGIAKVFGEGIGKTITGVQMGTPAYMSPEQVNSDKTIDHRSDIYSMGVLLYFLLTGKEPFIKNVNSLMEIYFKIINEPFPKYDNSTLLNDIIQKAVSKNRNDRFQEISEFKKAFDLDSNNDIIENPLKFPKFKIIFVVIILIFSLIFGAKIYYKNETLMSSNLNSHLKKSKTEELSTNVLLGDPETISENSKIVNIKENTIKFEENENTKLKSKITFIKNNIFDEVDQISDKREKTKYILDEIITNSNKYRRANSDKYNSLLMYALDNFIDVLPSNKESNEFIYFCNIKNELFYELKKSDLNFDEKKIDAFCLQ